MAFWQEGGSGYDVGYGGMERNPCFGCERMRGGGRGGRSTCAQIWFPPFANAMKAFVPRTIDDVFGLSGTTVVLMRGNFKNMVPSYNLMSM